MKLVEVVILVGSQCISPLQHNPHMTEAGKVDCAVLIHRDTESGAFAVVPPEAFVHPEVRIALERNLKPGDTSSVRSAAAEPAPPPRTTVIELLPAEETAQASGETAAGQQEAEIPATAPFRGKIAARYPEPAGDAEAAGAAPAPDGADGADSGQAAEPRQAVEVTPATDAETPKPKKVKASKSKSKSLTKRSGKQRTAARTVPAPAGYRDKCGKTRVARWYTNASGNKKYRCVLPGTKNIY